MFSITLPYFADPQALPSRLPTKEEIQSSMDVLKEEPARKVVGVGPHFVVKYGRLIDPTEGQNILFVKQNTSVPVPRVYAIYADMSDGKTYIVMERIIGDTLDSLWPILTDAEQAIIAAKLRGSMHQLRGLPSPGSYCSVGNRGLTDPLFRNDTEDELIAALAIGVPVDTDDEFNAALPIGGPFDTEDELNAALVKIFYLNTGLPGRASYFRRVFRLVFRDHSPTFSHGDFQKNNILVRKRESLDERPLEDSDVVLVDWEYSGWYPSYWEYAMAMFPWSKGDNGWDRLIVTVLDEPLLEWSWMNMYLLELF